MSLSRGLTVARRRTRSIEVERSWRTTNLLALSEDEVVLYASEGTRVGNYEVVSDATAAGGVRLHNPDAGAAKLSNALANPGTYVELQFTAQAGVAYRLWIRGKAQDDRSVQRFSLSCSLTTVLTSRERRRVASGRRVRK